MDVERLVVRLLADATQYNRTIDQVERRVSGMLGIMSRDSNQAFNAIDQGMRNVGMSVDAMNGATTRLGRAFDGLRTRASSFFYVFTGGPRSQQPGYAKFVDSTKKTVADAYASMARFEQRQGLSSTAFARRQIRETDQMNNSFRSQLDLQKALINLRYRGQPNSNQNKAAKQAEVDRATDLINARWANAQTRLKRNQLADRVDFAINQRNALAAKQQQTAQTVAQRVAAAQAAMPAPPTFRQRFNNWLYGPAGGGMGGGRGGIGGMGGGGGQNFGMFSTGMNVAASAGTHLLGVITRVTAAIGVVGLAGAMVMAGRGAIEMAADYEKATIAFEVMTHSAATGKKLLDDIARLAIESPFTSNELNENAKQVLAFGFEVNDVLPILSRLGDISSGTGSRLDRLVLAFGQVRSTGRLMGQELRQFTNAGVPILEYLGRVMGVASAQIPQMVRQGRVGFSDVAKAMNLMTEEGGLFSGMMDRINKETVSGRWQNLVESVQLTGRNFGLAFFEAFKVKEVLRDVGDAVRGMSMEKARAYLFGFAAGLQTVWQTATRLWKVLVELGAGVAGFVVKYQAFFTSLASSIAVVMAVIVAFKMLLGLVVLFKLTLALLLSPIGLVVAALTGLIYVLNQLGTLDGIGESFSQVFGKMAETFQGGWKALVQAVQSGDLKQATEVIFTGIEIAWKTMLVALEASWIRFGGRIRQEFSADGGFIITGAKLSMNNLDAALSRYTVGQFSPSMRAKIEANRLAEENRINQTKDKEVGRIYQETEDKVKKLYEVLDPLKNKMNDIILDTNVRSGLSEKARNIDKYFKDDMRLMPNGRGGLSPFIGQINVPEVSTGSGVQAALGGMAMPGVQQMYSDVFRNAVDKVMRIREAIMDNRTPTKAMYDEANLATKALEDFVAGLNKSSDAMRKIAEWPQISAEAIAAASQVDKAMLEGGRPFQQFTRQVGLIEEAYKGVFPKALGGVIGNLGVAAIPKDLFGGIMTDKNRDFGLFQAFDKLNKGGRPEDHMPPAAIAGSREAAEAINRANSQSLSVEEQVLQTLREQKAIDQMAAEYQRQVVEALKSRGIGTVVMLPGQVPR